MQMKTINDLIGSLTPEERKMHAELIEECIEREASCKKTSKKIHKDMEKLQNITLKLLHDIEKLNNASVSLKEECEKANERMMTCSLALIPDDHFFHA
jgi:hypothetical protein